MLTLKLAHDVSSTSFPFHPVHKNKKIHSHLFLRGMRERISCYLYMSGAGTSLYILCILLSLKNQCNLQFVLVRLH